MRSTRGSPLQLIIINENIGFYICQSGIKIYNYLNPFTKYYTSTKFITNLYIKTSICKKWRSNITDKFLSDSSYISYLKSASAIYDVLYAEYYIK